VRFIATAQDGLLALSAKVLNPDTGAMSEVYYLTNKDTVKDANWKSC